MADDAKEGPAAVENPAKKSGTDSKKQRRGLLSRIWHGIFSGREDFEKRLQDLSKEEASVHLRMKRRAQSWRKTARNIIVLSVILEVVAVAYAIMSTRSLDLNWQKRAVRVLPMFVLPGLSSVIYSALVSFTRMLDSKDQNTLERLRAERQSKIDELKESTNYYTTQQLIQRYDLDPAAKAAAATILASKLGADSGLQFYVGDESKLSAPLGKSNDVEVVHSDGLRNRKQSHTRSHSTDGGAMHQLIDETSYEFGPDGQEISVQNQRVVEHYKTSGTTDGGWVARIAAMLVGEDPTQCYALICGNCHMHNGLARKEDFPYVTYYCPHCHALNGSRQPGEPDSSSGSDIMGSGSGSGKASPMAPVNGNIVRSVSNASSVTEGEVISNLATVQEEPMGASDEKEVPGALAN